MSTKKISAPFDEKTVADLKSGDSVLITGTIYTARDAAHKCLTELIEQKKSLPFELRGAVVYYVGPSPEKPGQVIGSAGPTTSYRMDAYSTLLMQHGLKGMIGKGKRSPAVIDAMKNYRAVYLAATGGAGALLSKCIKKSEIIAFEELGPEAVRRLEVENFPAIVINDIHGNDLYDEGIKKYAR
ncbi:MAG: Fe-S-containing hydro-lyase [Elusimicrobia bacterium]|nr:Fe-S-containing hydro-lyase [Elusimicrobiota bacterium]